MNWIAGAALGAAILIGASGVAGARNFDCRAVEALGNVFKTDILAGINRNMPYSGKVGPAKNKTLIFERVRSAHFTGCVMDGTMDVKVKRKLRRDARGTVSVSGELISWNRMIGRLCVGKFKIHKIRVSNTTGLGEAVYKLVGKKAVPNQICVDDQRAIIRPKPLDRDNLCKVRLKRFMGAKTPNVQVVNKLCRGVESSDQPAVCYQTLAQGRISWGGGTVWAQNNMVELCQGTRNAILTINCFENAIRAGKTWQVGIRECKRRF